MLFIYNNKRRFTHKSKLLFNNYTIFYGEGYISTAVFCFDLIIYKIKKNPNKILTKLDEIMSGFPKSIKLYIKMKD